MKRILLVLVMLILATAPVHARYPSPDDEYKGTWYIIKGRSVRQEELKFDEPAPKVENLARQSPGIATRYEFFANGNYYCAYNESWEDYYICGANDGNNFFCKYYVDGNIVCTQGE